ncbi:tetraspanin [Laetiporus sulphureus 93-53]|uniref:Tetraspanin n=1 Tax=Laetiporus sulphureus 93-53 TaxID=1314785 RepID=A0A165CVV6_9APHY|nr:tetraspanin [Laetiporus sulphureus 93-53]KZT03532.1 tetraspanin [Laetiporus sulphureus 93-53]
MAYTRKIMAFFGFMDFLLLGIAIVSIVFSIVWREPDTLRNLELSTQHLNEGLIMGVILLVSWVVSVGALLSPNNSIKGFVLFNWTLALDAIVVLIVGTTLWFYTLMVRDNYLAVWEVQSTETRVAIQDLFSCCGYFEPNDTTVALGGFCANETFVTSLFNASDTTQNACVTSITGHAEPMLNQIFTYVYGFMAVVGGLFLASLCVIKTRQEKERFRRIDVKRGGVGFV